MDAKNSTQEPSRAWLIALLVLAGFAFFFTLSGDHDGQAEITHLEGQLVWPRALNLSESTSFAGMIEEEGAGRSSRDQVTLYALPDSEERMGYRSSSAMAEAFHAGQGLVEVTRGDVDENGQFHLNIPAVTEWGGSIFEDESLLEPQSRPPMVSLFFVVRLGRDEHYQWRRVPVVSTTRDDLALALTMDRPLYQPGQTMLMRTVAVESHGGSPLEEIEVRWQIRDPQGNLVFDQVEVTDRAGVSAVEFELADRCIQGDYEITVESDGTEIEQVVAVQPYRLPRYQVSVGSDMPRLIPGEPFIFTVDAEYIHGEKVANAEVRARFAWEVWGGTETLEFDGHTDDDGLFEYEWQVPSSIRPRTALRTNAVVTTDDGRAEEDSRAFAVATDLPDVEIFPLGRANFVMGQVNRAVVEISDSNGEPMAGEPFTVNVVDADGMLNVDLETDEEGRATFEWTPRRLSGRTAFNSVSVDVRVSSFPNAPQSVEVGLQRKPYLLRATAPSARVGEPYLLTIESHDNPVFLMTRNGDITTSLHILRPSSSSYEKELHFTDADRGLTQILAFNDRGLLDEMPLWVQQRGTESVEVIPEESNYAPGDTGWIDLSFPVFSESPQAGEVIFGVVGVDEALYALRERADVPFTVLLRQAPTIMGALLHLVDADADVDDVGRQIAASRFFQAYQKELEESGSPPSPSRADAFVFNGGQNFSHHIAEIQKERRGRIWAISLLLLLYGLMGVSVFLTSTTATRAAFTLKSKTQILLTAGGSAAAAMTLIAFALPFTYYLVGLLLVVAVVCLAGFSLLATVGQENFPALYWFLSIVAIIVAAVCTASMFDIYLKDYLSEYSGLMILLLLALPAIVIAVQKVLWIFIFLHREQKQAAFLLAGILGAVVGTLLSVFLLLYIDDMVEHTLDSIDVDDGWGHYSDEIGGDGPVDDFWDDEPIIAEGIEEMAWEEMEEDLDVISRTRSARPTRAPAARTGGAIDDSMDLSAPIRQEEPSPQAPAEQAGGAAPPPEGTIRSWFPETMIWRPSVESDAEGRARISFPIPDSMTTWRVNAWAHSRDGRFGEGDAELVVTRPIFLDLNLPTHMTDGDEIHIPATIVNSTDAAITVQVETETTGALRIGPVDDTDEAGRIPSPLEIGPVSRRTITVVLRADGVGDGELTVNIRTSEGVLIDGERRSATIAPHGRTMHDSLSGIVGDGAEHIFEIPREAIDDSSSLDVIVIPGAVADALEGLDGMLRQPFGCFEQTSSINFPNIMVLRTLEQTPPPRWPGGADAWNQAHERAMNFVHLGYQRILTFQNTNGGFALYPGNTPEVMLTAYGVIQLMAMSEVYAIDEEVIFRAVSWMAGQQESDGSWSSQRQRWRGDAMDAKLRTTAFVVMGMLQAPSAPYSAPTLEPALNFLEENLTSIESDGTLAIVANAFLNARRPETLRFILGRLSERVVRGQDRQAYWDETSAGWMGAGGNFARIETTAMAASAFLQEGSHADISGAALEFIAANRSPMGGWGTTQATVWSLMAMQHMARSDGEVTLELLVDDEPMPYAAGSARPGRLVIDSDAGLMSTFHKKIEGGDSPNLVITASQTSSASYRATAEYAIPWTTRAAANERGLAVSLLVADRQVSAHSMQSVTASIRNQGSDRHDTLIIEMPLPPAAFAPRDQFQDMVDRGIIDNFEIIPTHVRIYHEGLNPGQELNLEYSFSPMLRGRMILPPLRAYRFYTPQPLFESDSGVMTVQ